MTRRPGDISTHRTDGARGYTLTEVLVVVVIIGVAAAIVVPSMSHAGSLGVQAAVRTVVADILYAQNEAVAHARSRSVIFDVDNNAYRLADETGKTLSVAWRSGTSENYIVSLDTDGRFDGVRIAAADFGGSSELTFDDLGGPESGGRVELTYRQQRYAVDVAPFTGRVTIRKTDPIQNP